MQPEIPQTPVNGPEQMPLPPEIGGERVPSLPPLDASIERGAERHEQAAEAGAAASNMATGAPVAAPVPPVSPPLNAYDAAQGQAPVSGPVTAGDDDLIEKEWVDKAKSIVQSTLDNPHARTDKVSQLRQDYRKKRYGEGTGFGS